MDERAEGAFQFALGLFATILAGLVTADQLGKLFGRKATMDSSLGWVADHIAGGLSAEVPGVRELEQMREGWEQRHQIDFNASPITAMPNTIGRALADVDQFLHHKKMLSGAIRDMVTGSSYILRVAGGSQLGNTAQGIADFNKPGNVHPILGTVFGPRAEHDADYKPPRPRHFPMHRMGGIR